MMSRTTQAQPQGASPRQGKAARSTPLTRGHQAALQRGLGGARGRRGGAVAGAVAGAVRLVRAQVQPSRGVVRLAHVRRGRRTRRHAVAASVAARREHLPGVHWPCPRRWVSRRGASGGGDGGGGTACGILVLLLLLLLLRLGLPAAAPAHQHQGHQRQRCQRHDGTDGRAHHGARVDAPTARAAGCGRRARDGAGGAGAHRQRRRGTCAEASVCGAPCQRRVRTGIIPAPHPAWHT